MSKRSFSDYLNLDEDEFHKQVEAMKDVDPVEYSNLLASYSIISSIKQQREQDHQVHQQEKECLEIQLEQQSQALKKAQLDIKQFKFVEDIGTGNPSRRNQNYRTLVTPGDPAWPGPASYAVRNAWNEIKESINLVPDNVASITTGENENVHPLFKFVVSCIVKNLKKGCNFMVRPQSLFNPDYVPDITGSANGISHPSWNDILVVCELKLPKVSNQEATSQTLPYFIAVMKSNDKLDARVGIASNLLVNLKCFSILFL